MADRTKYVIIVMVLFYGFLLQPVSVLAGEKLVIGYAPSISAVLNMVAWKQGYFAKEGLEVELRNVDSGNKGVVAMLAGEIDVAESPVFGVVSQVLQRKDFKVFATMSIGGNYNMVLARTDRGVRSLKDLKGKKVGVVKGGLPQYVLDLMLLKIGMIPKDMIIVLDDVNNLPQRIASGELDAVCVFGNWIDKTRQALRGMTVEFHDQNLLRTSIVQVARTETFTRKPTAFVKLLRAYIRAEEFVKKHPDDALKTLSETLKLNITDIRKNWKPDLYQINLDQAIIKDMEAMARWQIESGLQKVVSVPNILDFIEFKPLESIDPGRVKVVHKK